MRTVFVLAVIALVMLYPGVSAQQFCSIYVPQFPNSIQGLTKPWVYANDPVLQPNAPCNQAGGFASFVEAVIFDPTPPAAVGGKNKLYVYQPLLIDQAVDAAGNPVKGQPRQPIQVQPTPIDPALLSQNAVIGIWFGSNAVSIKLLPELVAGQNSQALIQGNCVNGRVSAKNIGVGQGGIATDLFSQFAACNADAFWAAVNQALAAGEDLTPPVPQLGTAVDGLPCITTRDFSLVDMDPSDNVVTTYLLLPDGRTIQDTPTNRQTNPTALPLVNASDNRLVAVVLAAALKCTPYRVPNLTVPGATASVGAMALNEIHAMLRQQAPYAYLPRGNPFVKMPIPIGGQIVPGQAGAGGTNLMFLPDMSKLNNYRAAINQPIAKTPAEASTLYFCKHFAILHVPRLQKNVDLLSALPSPMADVANSLFTFMAQRFANSFAQLGCPVMMDVQNPVQLNQVNMITVGATFTIDIDTWKNRGTLIDGYAQTPAQ